MIDISKMDKAEVLAALFNASHPQGMGYLDPRCEEPLTVEKVREYLTRNTYFDYLHGRVLKVDLSRNEFDPRLYDRDNGRGAADLALASLRRP